MHLIIDGYNLIRQSDRLRRWERKSLMAGRTALIKSLAEYKTKRDHKITVVFDGWKSGEPEEERDREGDIDIIYSRLGEKADEVIKRIAEKSGEETVIVSSDREIASYITRLGKTPLPSADFAKLVFRAIAEIPAYTSGTENPADEESRRTRKKGPAHRLSRTKKLLQMKIRKL